VSLGLPTLRVGPEPLTSPGVGTLPIYDPTDGQR
jgi:tRNA-2-methylthio-N6-dimethylallyladenosine synthase